MGITIREVIDIYGKGMKDGKKLKLVQSGGSSGSIAPASLQDVPLDFDSFRNAGISLGSGALLVCNEDTCVVDLAKVILRFFRNESCGKCTPCREGTYWMEQILSRMQSGEGTAQDNALLKDVALQMRNKCLCALGDFATMAVVTALEQFPEDFVGRMKAEG